MTTEATEVTANATVGGPATHSDIPKIVAGLRQTFATGKTRSVEWRRAQLRALEKMIAENEPAIADALAKDLDRSPFEAWLADAAATAGEARYAAKHVKKWMRRKYRRLELAQLPGRGWVEYEPYGTVLIIGAWNYPFYLTLGPAVGAIAAGNAVILKPSEIAAASSRVMAELVPRYLDNDAIARLHAELNKSCGKPRDAAQEFFGGDRFPALCAAKHLRTRVRHGVDGVEQSRGKSAVVHRKP